MAVEALGAKPEAPLGTTGPTGYFNAACHQLRVSISSKLKQQQQQQKMQQHGQQQMQRQQQMMAQVDELTSSVTQGRQ